MARSRLRLQCSMLAIQERRCACFPASLPVCRLQARSAAMKVFHGGQCAVSSNRSKKWAQSLRLAMAGLPLFRSPGQSPCDRLSTPHRERTGQIVRSPRRPVCRRYYYRHRAPSDPQSHRDLLEQCGAQLTVTATASGSRISINPSNTLSALGDYQVAGDLSSAAFFIASTLLVPGSEVLIRAVGANPSRMALIDVIRRPEATF